MISRHALFTSRRSSAHTSKVGGAELKSDLSICSQHLCISLAHHVHAKVVAAGSYCRRRCADDLGRCGCGHRTRSHCRSAYAHHIACQISRVEACSGQFDIGRIAYMRIK